jgi:endonuclease YncB( thermonuclease family)
LSIRGKLLPLYGVEGVYEPHVASLVAFIHDREVECKPEGDESYRCILAGADLSEVILANGAAKVKPDAPEHLKAAESKAREAAKGVWQ